jgi:hypothetical protein
MPLHPGHFSFKPAVTHPLTTPGREHASAKRHRTPTAYTEPVTAAGSGRASADDAGRAWAASPPAWARPVSVPLNVTLVQQPDLVARVTGACAFPTGFLFFLVLGFDIRSIPFERLDFYAPREPAGYPAPARLQVRFSDGRVADSSVKTHHRPPPEEAVMIFDGGNSKPCEPGTSETDAFRRHERRWWVSPLPSPGMLEFTMRMRDSSTLAGAAGCDAGPILAAASRSVPQWSAR